MKVEIERRDFSWVITVNDKQMATVWMGHNRPKGVDWEVMDGILRNLNTEKEIDKKENEITS